MKKGQRLWSREELILALNLYCKLSFGQMHERNPEIKELADLINRTPGSVSLKLVNFASLDPGLQARNIKGMANASNLDKLIWNEFYGELQDYAFKSEKDLAQMKQSTVENVYKIREEELPGEGLVREQIVKVRVNQAFFRRLVLSSYNYTCCITGLHEPGLLIAGHISPWGLDKANRMNPRNGIAINALHDKAFENGLITITPEYKVKISSRLLMRSNEDTIANYFITYNDKEIKLPDRFLPDRKLLEDHYKNRFIP